MRKHFKFIRSNEKDVNGKTIYSGQIVSVYGRINPKEIVEVLFEPSFGFRIQGNNFADAYDVTVIKDITLLQKITGSIRYIVFNLFGR